LRRSCCNCSSLKLRFGIVVSERASKHDAEGLLAEAMRRLLCATPQDGLVFSARRLPEADAASN